MKRALRSGPVALACLSCFLGISCSGDDPPTTADMGMNSPDLTQRNDGPGLEITVRDSDSMEPFPARVLISAVSPTRKPDFHSNGTTTREMSAGVIGSPEGVLLATGAAARIPLPAGTYDLTILQGPEYEWQQRRVTISGKQVVPLDLTLQRAFRTDGWLAADMHIHSSRSFDSKIDAGYRIVSEVASGVEVLVPTEHSLHTDLAPQIDAMGYGARAVSIPGSEYGFNGGHLGVYPVIVEPDRPPLFGGPKWQEWPWTNVLAETHFPLIHDLPGSPLIIINHPRLPPDLGYFFNIGWQPNQPLATANLFDGMEVLAGYEGLPEHVTALLRDWFYFLNEGRRIVGVGNSDTHRIDWLRAGYPRTWLRLATDAPDRVLPVDLREALQNQRAIASNGPFVRLTVDGKDIGDQVTVQGGKVSVHVVADAAGWVDLSRVQLYRNGALVREFNVDRKRHPALDQTISFDAPGDGWLVAVAVGDRELPTAVIGEVFAGKTRPLAFTNPIWIDRDGDGKIVIPGANVPAPQPWGTMPMDPRPNAGADIFRPLHAPLDCAPEEYLDWAMRHSDRF